LTPKGIILILPSVFEVKKLQFGLYIRIQYNGMEFAMKSSIALFLPAAFAALSFSASAGVAPTAPNSALTQAGAKIAPPAGQGQLTDDKDDKKDNAPKDPAK